MEQMRLNQLQERGATKASLDSEWLAQRLAVTEAELARVLKELYELRNLPITDHQLRLLMQEQLEQLRQDL